MATPLSPLAALPAQGQTTLRAETPLAHLIRFRCRELDLTGEALGFRLGYQNPAKAAGRVRALCDGQLTSPKSRLTLFRLAAALQMPPDTVDAARKATEAFLAESTKRREQLMAAQAAAEAVWQAHFQVPAIF